MDSLPKSPRAMLEETTHRIDFSPRGLVGDIDHFAVHDGPGIRTAVYLKGCQLRCSWCHSPETQSFSPELLFLPQKCNACGRCLEVCAQDALTPVDDRPADGGVPGCRVAIDWQRCTHCGACAAVCFTGALKIAGTWMTAGEVLSQVEKDQPFFAASGGGVTLTGGEATAQPVFARQFLAGCRALGIHTALETNGCVSWQVFQDLIPVVDLFLYDIKHMDDASHSRLTGVSNRLPLENLRRLAGLCAAIIVRVPCIPGLNDDAINIDATAAYARQVGVKTIHLLPYNASAGAKYAWLGRNYSLPDWQSQSSEKMDELAGICRSYGLSVEIGG